MGKIKTEKEIEIEKEVEIMREKDKEKLICSKIDCKMFGNVLVFISSE